MKTLSVAHELANGPNTFHVLCSVVSHSRCASEGVSFGVCMCWDNEAYRPHAGNSQAGGRSSQIKQEKTNRWW